MVSHARLVLAAACLLAFGVSSAAQADPITVTFTAFPAPGDTVNAGSSPGFFTFDSSLIPPGGGQVQDSTHGLGVTEVSFTWGNTVYTRANADVGELQFSPTGQLLAFVLGGTYSPYTGLGGIYAFLPNPAGDDFFAASFAGVGGASNIIYTLAGYEGQLTGRLVSESVPFVPAPVPEPSSLLMLAAGAAVLRGRWRVKG